jgi:hypothetical protein
MAELCRIVVVAEPLKLRMPVRVCRVTYFDVTALTVSEGLRKGNPQLCRRGAEAVHLPIAKVPKLKRID